MQGKIYPTYKIAALDAELTALHVPTDVLLANTGLKAAEIHSPATRIAREQLIQAYRNALSASPVADIALRTGQRLRLSAYGMYGYALVASANLRDALEFSIRYHELATPTVRMSLRLADDENQAIFAMQDIIGDESIYRFNLELQFSLVQSLFRDMAGEDFCFSRINAAYPQPPDCDYAPYLEAEIQFDAPANEMRFDEWWLTKPLLRANPITATMLQETCDQILHEMKSKMGFARQVRDILSADLRNASNIDAVAQRLDSTARTLRRRLNEEGTSFQQLLAEVRASFAIAFLRDTQMTVDDIAERLGFSDAANFRHAFKRWTGHTPSHYRSSSADNPRRF